MKRTRKALCLVLILLLVFNGISSVQALGLGGRQIGDGTIQTNGWDTDVFGTLVPDADGYYVYTITKDNIDNGMVFIDLDPFASLLLSDFRNVSSNRSTKKLKIINESGKVLHFEDYRFSTENELPRTDRIFDPSTGSLGQGLNRGMGSAYQAMVTTITSPNYRTDWCIDTQGFDNKNMNLMLVPLRTLNDAVATFYGKSTPHEVTLQELMHLDQNLKNVGFSSYAAYLKAYYKVTSLNDLNDRTVYHILGTGDGAQTAITSWKGDGLDEKAIRSDELNQLTEEFKIWGLTGLNGDPEDSDVYTYGPNFFMMETDPEILAFAYDYLYENGIRFTFDDQKFPFDRTDNYYGKGGAYGIRSYVEQSSVSNQMVYEIFGGHSLEKEGVLLLDHISAGLYVPNAWNQHRMYDFGIALLYSVEEEPIIPINPTKPPKTGDESTLTTWVVVFCVSLAGFLFLLFLLLKDRKKRKKQMGYHQ